MPNRERQSLIRTAKIHIYSSVRLLGNSVFKAGGGGGGQWRRQCLWKAYFTVQVNVSSWPVCMGFSLNKQDKKV